MFKFHEEVSHGGVHPAVTRLRAGTAAASASKAPPPPPPPPKGKRDSLGTGTVADASPGEDTAQAIRG